MTQSPRPILALGQRPRILQLQEVDKTFNGTVAALQELSLSVNEGDPDRPARPCHPRLDPRLHHQPRSNVRFSSPQPETRCPR